MQWLAALCVRRPVFASVLVLVITVIGAFGYVQLGIDRFPKIDFPTVLITTRQPGAAPEQVESEITDKIEEAVNTISGLDELRSTSAEGVSIVSASFLLEKNGDVAAQEVRDKVNRVLPQLPRNIFQPTIERMDTDSAPIIGIAVSAPRSEREITEYADKELRRRLETVTGVGQVMVLGGRARQINVWLDPTKLRAHNITVVDVSRALQAQNIEVPGGRIEQGPVTLTLRTRGRVATVEQFGEIVVRMRDGHPILVSDVARVEDGMAEPSTRANIDGTPTIVLYVRRQSGTNAVQVVNAVKARLDDLTPTLPPGYHLRIVRDQSEFIVASIRAVKEHLIVGALLAAIVVLLFLNNWRSTVIAAIAIPTSIIASFGLIWYMGFTLNSMTMLALTLSVGIVIDDAIVVLENIYRFIEEKGRPPFEAAVEATREIGLAVLATTLSLVAIFLPVGFMSGMAGRFLQSFGFTMAFAILVSLLVSFTLTPMLGARWLKLHVGEKGAHPKHASRDTSVFHAIDARYTRLLRWALGRRGLIAVAAVLVFLSSAPLFMVVAKNFLPTDDQGEFEIGIRAPEGTSLQATELYANRIANAVKAAVPDVAFSMVTVADDTAKTPNAATVYFMLKPLGERKGTSFTAMDIARDKIVPTFAAAGLRTAVRPIAAMSGGGNSSAEIQFVMIGPDLAKLQQYAQAVAAETRKVPGAVDVDISLNPGKPEVQVTIDRAKAADLGVQVGDAADAMRLLVGGDQVTTYNEGDEQYEVHLRATADYRRTAEDVGALSVPSSRLGSVALNDVATFTAGTSPAEVQRLNRSRQVTVYASLLPGTSQTPVMAAMQEAASRVTMGPEYLTRFAGRSRELGRTATAFITAFLLSLVFMYLILAAQFESWLHPITILLSLPLTLPFALISIIVTGQSLNIFSALGLLVLFGVVKKNSILQIDRANQLREGGMERHDAVVQASRDRLRPILMTTMSFVAGMFPLVISGGAGSGTNRAIGFVIIGGQTLVLLLTLVVTPVAYSLLDDLSQARLGTRLVKSLVRLWPGAARTAGLFAVAMACAAQALAQSGPAPALTAARAAAASPAQGGPVLRLTVEDAVRMGLENNPDIHVSRLDPRIADERVGQARAAYTPNLLSSVLRNNQTTPPTSFLVGTQGVTATTASGSVGIAQRLPWLGTSYSVSFDATKATTTSTFTNFNPSLAGRVLFSMSQPLLKDLRIDAARQTLQVSRGNRDISDARFRETVVRTLADVKRAYWDLVAARSLMDVQARSLELSTDLVRINRARVQVGQAPPLDLVAAQAEEAQRQEAVTIAEVQARQAEDRLRLMIFDASQASFWATALDPVDRPSLEQITPDVDAVVGKALETRLDLVRARIEVANADTTVRFSRNQTLPDLRVAFGYTGNSLAGTRLIRTGGFPGTVTGSEVIPFSTAMDQLRRADFPSWNVVVNFSYPLGRSLEDAALARARLEADQARMRLANLEIAAVRQLRSAAWQIEMNAKRIITSRAARSLAEERANTEQKRFDVGLSTSFLVVQAQRDLAQARNNELSAALDYVRAVIEFETLQQAGPSSSASSGTTSTTSMTVTGTSLGSTSGAR
jgi:hydrophobic/amphiphilic exporter-1 (mainly G- bacteria), HAE1 family